MFTKLELRILSEWQRAFMDADKDAINQGMDIYSGATPKEIMSAHKSIKTKLNKLKRRGPCNFKLKKSKMDSRSKRAN